MSNNLDTLHKINNCLESVKILKDHLNDLPSGYEITELEGLALDTLEAEVDDLVTELSCL